MPGWGTIGGVADSVRLLSAEPDLGRFLAPEERSHASELAVPLVKLSRGDFDAHALFAHTGAFGGIVLDGMLIRTLDIGNSPSMRLIGPGDLLGRMGDPGSSIPEARMSALDGTEIALLRGEFLRACSHWPGLVAGLHVRSAEQAERLAQQLAICQLPRVDDRLLALLWWLADVWGRVTSVGTIVPVSMTHDVLGSLVGARRPTVTLALGQLVSRGAIVRQDRGWLLVERPAPVGRPSLTDTPGLLPTENSSWHRDDGEDEAAQRAHEELLENVRRLRLEYEGRAAAVQARLREVRAGRERVIARRRGVVKPRRAPSS